MSVFNHTKSKDNDDQGLRKEKVLAETPITMRPGQLFKLRGEISGTKIAVFINDKKALSAHDATIPGGGAGYFVERGVCAFRETRIGAQTQSGI